MIRESCPSGETRRARRPDPGQALLEFAVVLPLLLFILAGFLDLGRAIYYYNVVASAAREGARYGITDPDNTALIRQVAAARAVNVGIDESQISVACSGTCKIGETISVTVPYTFQPITLYFLPIPLTGKSTMTIEFRR